MALTDDHDFGTNTSVHHWKGIFGSSLVEAAFSLPIPLQLRCGFILTGCIAKFGDHSSPDSARPAPFTNRSTDGPARSNSFSAGVLKLQRWHVWATARLTLLPSGQCCSSICCHGLFSLQV